MSDYTELPEKLAAAVALLLDAERRANPELPRCERCGHTATLRVNDAEWRVLAAIRDAYAPRAAQRRAVTK